MKHVRVTLAITRHLRSAAVEALTAHVAGSATLIGEATSNALRGSLARCWGQAIRRGMRDTRKAIGQLDGKADDDLWQRFVDEYVRLYGLRTVDNIIGATRDQIIAKIQDGLSKGHSVEDVAKAIRESIPAIARARAATIARTETHSAAQFASIETAKLSPHPLLKTWVSTIDPRTRDFGEGDGKIDTANHRAMRGVTVPLDVPFQVPNKFGAVDLMQFPGDQSAPAYQCVNCRCAMTFKRATRWSF